MINDSSIPKRNYWLLAHKFKQELDQIKVHNEGLIRAVEILSTKRNKTLSGQYVLLNERNGKFCDPIIVDADSQEEALCPEDGSGEHQFVIPIPEPNEFSDL